MVKYTDLVSDTICSQITPPGHAGVSVVRVSGEGALKSVRRLCTQLPSEVTSHRAYLSPLIDSLNQNVLDSVLVTYFQKGQSFTGDEVVEISCHGNPLIVQNVIHQLLQNNCRLAERGEFSFRAFFNGKIDLVQAESINALIHSPTQQQSSLALDHLDGNLSSAFSDLEKKLLLILGQLEAAIDFVEQDIDPESYQDCRRRCQNLLAELEPLIASYDIGKNLADRWNIVLAGETNVGKSSLFNALFDKSMAIVSDEPGTTRDLVTRDTFLDTFSVQFMDSAGLREQAGWVESLGIQKTKEAMLQASLVLWVVDGSCEIPWEAIDGHRELPLVLIANKIDLLSEGQLSALSKEVEAKGNGLKAVYVSAVSGKGVDHLKSELTQTLSELNRFEGSTVVTQARHYDHLVNLREHLRTGQTLLEASESPDLVSQEFQWGLQDLQALLGKSYDDEILDTIFSEFCLGK